VDYFLNDLIKKNPFGQFSGLVCMDFTAMFKTINEKLDDAPKPLNVPVYHLPNNLQNRNDNKVRHIKNN
jgi:hypothetical protein